MNGEDDYTPVGDDFPVTLVAGKPARMACCDCALVHIVEISELSEEEGAVTLRFKRDNRATGQRRRHGHYALKLVKVK